MIPKIIWQTYETNFDSLPQGAKDLAQTWKDKNTNWAYKYMSDLDRRNFILNNYDKEWYEIYNSYTLNALRSDLWRYLVINKLGGLYVDIDTSCNIEIDSWLDDNFNFVISAEYKDPDLTQMIFASEPNNTILNNLLNDIKIAYKNNVKYSNRFDYNRFNTGYTILTNSIKKSLNLSSSFNFAKDSISVYNKNNEYNAYIFAGEESKVIHEHAMTHYHAGYGNLWENYQGWHTVEWIDNE